MKMNWNEGRKAFRQVLAWGALVALTGAIAVAQDQGGAQGQASDQGQAQAAASQRSDGQIEMDVVHALDGSKALKKDLITAATIQGEVTLSGTVGSEASSELAESIAGRVAGVTAVHNNLKVGDVQQAQAAPPAAPGTQQMADSQGDDAMTPVPPPPPPAADGPMPAPGEAPYPSQQGQSQAQPQGQPQSQYGGPMAAPQERPQYVPAHPRIQRMPQPSGPVTVAEGTLLQLRTSEAVNSKRAKDGEPVQFTVIADVNVGGVLAIPRGATVHGVVTDVKKVGAGSLGGSPELALKLTSLDLGGQSYPLDTEPFKVKGPNKAGQTVGNAVAGGLIGTIIGCAAGRGFGCAVGAGAGVAAGTAASAASPGPGIWIPAEARVDFHLTTPLTVNPVSAQEAARLAQGLYPGGPTLYRRGYYPYGGGLYAAGYPYYAYPPVYYRPYYMAGGYYYWR
jgi:hypothetical protein